MDLIPSCSPTLPPNPGPPQGWLSYPVVPRATSPTLGGRRQARVRPRPGPLGAAWVVGLGSDGAAGGAGGGAASWCDTDCFVAAPSSDVTRVPVARVSSMTVVADE